MKFLDLFSGIGGFRLGLEQAGHTCVGFCEINDKARQAYKAIHNTEGEIEWHDITQVANEQFKELWGTVDIICGGFPCQPFSIGGKRGGFSDTRGTMFFEIARATEQIKPRFLFLENVKGLLNHNEGETFGTIINTLDELGYDAEWQVCNSKNYGVPQNRERVFIVGHNRQYRTKPIFPITGTTTGVLKSIQADTSGKGHKSQQDRFYLIDGIMCTLPHARAKTKCCVCDENGKLMILTSKERMRLQGFTDESTKRALNVVSENDLCNLVGNSVTIPVVYEIAKRLR